MKVYVLVGLVSSSEWFDLLSVFSTQEKATEKAKQEHKKGNKFYGLLMIIPFDIDGEKFYKRIVLYNRLEGTIALKEFEGVDK